jgi:glucose-6-phosphate isomerase, archaeal
MDLPLHLESCYKFLWYFEGDSDGDSVPDLGMDVLPIDLAAVMVRSEFVTLRPGYFWPFDHNKTIQTRRSDTMDLRNISGLPIEFDRTSLRLVCGSDMAAPTPQPRLLDDLRDVLLQPDVVAFEEAYWMYRGISRSEDKQVFDDRGFRFDITIMRPGFLGLEYVKTSGHYHPVSSHGNLPYPEVYEVLHGKAHYLLQKMGASDAGDCSVEDVILVEARPGDKVVMLPGYGHVTINPGPEPLIMADVVSSSFSSVYEPMQRCRGAAYYEVQSQGAGQFIANTRYPKATPALRRLAPSPVAQLGLAKGIPLYASFIADPRKFEWLESPDGYEEAFAEALR